MFPFKIVRKRNIPKIERKLDLQYFFTFKDGTDIFTFKDEDISQMSSRHYEKLKTDIRMVTEYGMTRERRDMYVASFKEISKKGINGEIKQGEAMAKLWELANDFERQYNTEIDIQDQMWLSMYCMFFVLDTENELIYSPSQNARKIELLQTCTDEEKELFFSLVQIRLNYYKNTLVKDTVNSLLEMTAVKNQGELLTSLTDQIASIYTQQNSQT